jgi:Fic family protein
MEKSSSFRRYNWQHPNWPNFQFDLSGIQDLVYRYVMEAALLVGGLEQLPNDVQDEAIIDVMVNEALKSSEIEGEKIDYEDIRSSIQKELGISSLHIVKDARAVGIAKLMVSLKQTYQEPLTKKQLFEWHSMLLSDPGQRQGVDIGMWRRDIEPMQIISGPIGHEAVHFEAPPSERISQEMTRFIEWFNTSASSQIPGIVRAAIAHIYFESIHPFGDGNGRIGRAISEKALSQELRRPVFFSLSTTIQKNKKDYYAELSRASHCSLDITSWINYFVKTIYQAQLDAKKKIQFIFDKTKFWIKYENFLNERQEKVISRIFEAGVSGFVGGMSATKYMSIVKCSKATATRDLAELLELGCIIKLPGRGRSTRYSLSV